MNKDFHNLGLVHVNGVKQLKIETLWWRVVMIGLQTALLSRDVSVTTDSRLPLASLDKNARILAARAASCNVPYVDW